MSRNRLFRSFSRSRSRRRNPSSKMGSIVKRTFTKQNLTPVAGLTTGFLGGSVVANKLRGWMNTQTFSGAETAGKFLGALNLILGAALAVKGKGSFAKSAGSGVALSGAYDLVQVNVESLALPSINPTLPGIGNASTTPAAVSGMELGWIGARTRRNAMSTSSRMNGMELDGDRDYDESAL